VAARLLIDEHAVPDLVRVQVLARDVQQRVGLGGKHARDESFAHQRALAVAAIGIEAVADHGLAIANHVSDYGHQAQRHLAEVDIGVADGRADGLGLFADFDDLHGSLLSLAHGPARAAGHDRLTKSLAVFIHSAENYC
jgi:hypothetical protein